MQQRLRNLLLPTREICQHGPPRASQHTVPSRESLFDGTSQVSTSMETNGQRFWLTSSVDSSCSTTYITVRNTGGMKYFPHDQSLP